MFTTLMETWEYYDVFPPVPQHGSICEDGFRFRYDPYLDAMTLSLKTAIHGFIEPSIPYKRETPESLEEIFRIAKLIPGWMDKNFRVKNVFFWRGQLRHYGLPTAQKKEVCRERLADAIRAGTLQVPEWLLQLEKDLKEQFDTEPQYEDARKRQQERKVEKKAQEEKRKAEEEERKEEYRRLHPPKETFSYDPDGDCLTVAVRKAAFATSVEKREPLEKLNFLLYNDDSLVSMEKSLFYWKAQLVHHGMPLTQPKARCKKQLLDAVKAGTLKVPQNLVELEAQLRAEYHEKRRAEMTPAERALDEQKFAPEKVSGPAEAESPVLGAVIPPSNSKRTHDGESENMDREKRQHTGQIPDIKIEYDETADLPFDDDMVYAESEESERSDFEYEMTPGDGLFECKEE